MLKTLNDRALIKPEEKPDQTSSGILLAEKVKEKPVIGEVVVGNSEVKKGDRVIFSRFGYDEVTIEDEVYYLVSNQCLLAILN